MFGKNYSYFDVENGDDPIDAFEKKLNVGDKVATTFYGNSSLDLVKIVNFTRFKVGVLSPNGDYCTKYPRQVVLVEGDYAF